MCWLVYNKHILNVYNIPMKFIDDMVSQFINPPKIRYSPYDLGTHPSTQALLSLLSAKDTISSQQTAKITKYKSVFTNPTKQLVEYA